MKKNINSKKNNNIVTTPKEKRKKIIKFIVIFILIIVTILLYARYIGTFGIKVKEYKVTNNILPDNFHGLKIAHISDIHYGRVFNEKNLDNLNKEVELLKPDIIVITGDLLDRNTKVNDKIVGDLTECLKKMKASIGKYIIMGNHDYPHKEWENIVDNSNFINLNDTYEFIYNDGYEPILLSGMSTNLHGEKTINEKISNINNYYNLLTDMDENGNHIDNIKYKILLMHEPDYIKDFDYSDYNLILAGHSHNGQVRLPLIGALILPEGSRKYYKPYYKLNDTELYISNGLGVSSVNFRLFNKPSISLYRLTNK